MSNNPYQSPHATSDRPIATQPRPYARLFEILSVAAGTCLGFAIFAALLWRDAIWRYDPNGGRGGQGGFFAGDLGLMTVFLFPVIGGLVGKWTYRGLRRSPVAHAVEK